MVDFEEKELEIAQTRVDATYEYMKTSIEQYNKSKDDYDLGIVMNAVHCYDDAVQLLELRERSMKK